MSEALSKPQRVSARIAARPSKKKEPEVVEVDLINDKQSKRKRTFSSSSDNGDKKSTAGAGDEGRTQKLTKFDKIDAELIPEEPEPESVEEQETEGEEEEAKEGEYDLSAVPSMDLVANMNTLHGGMRCFRKLMIDSPVRISLIEQPRRRNVTSQVDSQETESESPVLATESALNQGQAQFQELARRLKISKNQKTESVDNNNRSEEPDFHDENVFDLETPGQLMRSVFSDFDEKSRLCDLHYAKIQKASQAKILRHFERIKKDLQEVFSGASPSRRRDLFVSMNPVDRSELQGKLVADPFSNYQAMEISERLQKLLFPVKVEFNLKNYVDFVKLVLLPEALIRIYGSINKISYEQSQNEMKWGPRYDGPIG